MSKVEEFIAETKLNDLLHKKEAESQKKTKRRKTVFSGYLPSLVL